MYTLMECKKDTANDRSLGFGVIRLNPLQKSTKLLKICENKIEKNGQGYYVKQMNIGSLTDGGGQLRICYRGQFQSRRIAERVDAERMYAYLKHRGYIL